LHSFFPVFLVAVCGKNKRKPQAKTKKCAPNANNDKTSAEAAAEVAKCRQTNKGEGVVVVVVGKGGNGTQKWQNKSALQLPSSSHPSPL